MHCLWPSFALIHYRWPRGYDMISIVIFSRVVSFRVSHLNSFIFNFRPINLIDRGLISICIDASLRFIFLFAWRRPCRIISTSGIHNNTFIFDTGVVYPINDASSWHDRIASAYNVRRCSPGILHRLISAFHNIHDWIQEFLILKIYVSLLHFFSFVSKTFNVIKLFGWRLVNWLFHFNNVIHQVLLILSLD